GRRARGAAALRVGRPLGPGWGRGAGAAHRHSAVAAQPRPDAAARTTRAGREKKEEVAMKPVNLVRKLRRDAAFEPAALERGKEEFMAAIRQEVAPRRRPATGPQL